MRKTISHLADRLGDAMATLFTLLALLLIPHAVIRAIIGQALHQWTPLTWHAIRRRARHLQPIPRQRPPQTPHVGKPRRRRPRTMASDSQGRDHRDAGQPGDRRNGMSHTAIILLALAFLIGWMGGRE